MMENIRKQIGDVLIDKISGDIHDQVIKSRKVCGWDFGFNDFMHFRDFREEVVRKIKKEKKIER